MGSSRGSPQQTCREFIAQNCKASVLRVFPGGLLDARGSMMFERLPEQVIERLRQQENFYWIPGFVNSGPGCKQEAPAWHLRYLRPFECSKKPGSISSSSVLGQIRSACR